MRRRRKKRSVLGGLAMLCSLPGISCNQRSALLLSSLCLDEDSLSLGPWEQVPLVIPTLPGAVPGAGSALLASPSVLPAVCWKGVPAPPALPGAAPPAQPLLLTRGCPPALLRALNWDRALHQRLVPSWSLAVAPGAAVTRMGLPHPAMGPIPTGGGGGGDGAGACPFTPACRGLWRWHHMSSCPPSPARSGHLNPSALSRVGGREGQMLP